MGTYYIKDIESITGIKAHTIRVWEQRYNLVPPKRTDTNIRFYDDEDVKLLLNIALLNKKGVKISKIANLSRNEIHSEALLSCKKCNVYDDLINSLVLATYNLNEASFNKIFSNFVLQEGFENAIIHLCFPFLKRIGDLWVTDALNAAHEHFASNIIRKKLELAAENLKPIKEGARKFLLALPPEEFHEISLLFANYVIRSQGHEVLYLGPNTPVTDIDTILDVYRADYLVSIFTNSKSDIDPGKYVNRIHQQWPSLKFLLSGSSLLNQLDKLSDTVEHTDRVFVLYEPSDLSRFLEEKMS